MKILVSPHPTLRKVTQEIKQLDKKLERLIKDMTVTLRSAQDPEGVGLAAPQVGVSKRLLLLNLNNKIEAIINPQVIKQSEALLSSVYTKKKDRWLEGCLSLPKLWGFVDRPFSVDIEYVTPSDGVLVSRSRHFEGVESSYILHEIDHLDGVLFTDRILEQDGTIYKESPDGLVRINSI